MRLRAFVCGILGLLLLSGVASAQPVIRPRILINGAPLTTLASERPFIQDGRTMISLDAARRLFRTEGHEDQSYLPLRHIAESMGATVTWNQATFTVGVQLPTRHRWVFMSDENLNWWDPDGFPATYTGSFWAPDDAKELPPVAYGTLGYHQTMPLEASIRSYSLEAALPQVPETLPVYLQGVYPPAFKLTIQRAVERSSDWYITPQWALLAYQGEVPLGEKAPVRTSEEAERRAAELLGPLLEGENRAVVRPHDHGWTVVFHRVAGGVRMVGRPMTVSVTRDGQAGQISGRRRPLLAWSSYPLISPEQAWQMLREGRWLHLYVDEPELKGTVQEFAVTEVELVYHEQHSDFPLQVMPPYYAFRDKEGHTLYVPAVASQYTTVP